MTAVGTIGSDDSVKARLIRDADDEIAACGTDALQMEAVAKRAGVSRATAFRQLGNISEVLVQVAVDDANEKHAKAAQVKKFFLLDPELSPLEGELTPTLKLKRKVVNERFVAQFDRLYETD